MTWIDDNPTNVIRTKIVRGGVTWTSVVSLDVAWADVLANLVADQLVF